LHIRLFCLLWCVLSLTSCVYYGDLHTKAKPFSTTDLNTSHLYNAKPGITSTEWWNRFHDPELNLLISSAIAGSPDMQIAESRVRRAQAIVEGATAPLWPSIDFSGYIQRQKLSEFGLIPPPFNGRTFNIGELGFNLNYDFDFWGKNRQILASRISEKCASQADLAQARLILSAAVADTYFQLLNNQAQQQLALENLQLTREISDIVLERARHGIESDIPVKTALANVQLARLSVDQYRQAEMLAQNQLAILLGKNPFATTIITHHFTYHKQHVSLARSLPANLLAQRPDIYAAKLRAEAAAHEINVAKSRFFPNISLTSLFSYESVGLGHLFDVASQNNAITGAVDLPIFDAGARRANLGVKSAEYDMAVNSYNQTVLNALREVADQLAIMNTVKNQLRAQDRALQATEHNYKLFNSRYNHGIVDYVQVLEIKQLLLQYHATQLDLQTRHLRAVVGVLKALGGNEMSEQG